MTQALANLAEYLSATFQNESELRIKAEAELKKFSESPQIYLSGLLELISTFHPDINSQLKNAAAINLKKLMKETCESPNTSVEQKIYFANSIFSVLTANGLETPTRNSMAYALVPIFAGQPDVITAFLPTLLGSMNGGTFSVLGSIKAVKAIYGGFVHNPILFAVFKKIAPSFVEMTNKMTQSIGQALQQDNKVLAYEYAEILFEITSSISSIFEYFEISSKQNLGELKNYAELPAVLVEILKIETPQPGIIPGFIFSTQVNNLSIKLNQTKTQVFRIFNIMLQYLIDFKKAITEKESAEKVITGFGISLPDSFYLNSLSEMLPRIISSTECLLYSHDLETLVETEHISEFLIEIFLILNKILGDARFSQFFIESFEHIIVNICLPLLKSTKSDLETFEESPEEFVSSSADLCGQQESETIKSTTASFLEHLTNKIDGAQKFLISFCCELIDWTITKKDFSTYLCLCKFSQSHILQYAEELRIDSSLLSMCIVSNGVSKRPDLRNTIEILLQQHLNALYVNGTGLIKNRLCMLIHYYCEFLYENDETSYKALILIVLNLCNPQFCAIPSVNIEASETLSSMLQEEDVMMRIYNYIPDIIASLISIIDSQNNKAFFEALQEIITSNTEVVLQHLNTLIPALTNKVISETHLKKNKKSKKNSIVVVKCWNIIRTLAECKTLSKVQILELEDQFKPLIEYIQSPQDIEFDDDIILFEIAVMRKCELVTNIGWQIFDCMKAIQEKYDNSFIQLFQLLNCYIYYGQAHLHEFPEKLAVISDMCGKCLFAIYKSKINEATNAEAALIYQQLLLTFKGRLDSILANILAFVILKLTTPIKNEFFKVRLFGVILAAFSYDTNLTLRILMTSKTPVDQTYFEYIFNEIKANASEFKHSYDKKVAILGLSSFFSEPELQSTYAAVFQIMVTILSNFGNDVTLLKPEFLPNPASQIEDMKIFNNEEIEASLALTVYLTPASQFDEYDYFRNLVKNFQRGDLEILVKSLTKTQAEKLTKILQSKRIPVGDNPAHTEIRIIAKAKHKFKN